MRLREMHESDAQAEGESDQITGDTAQKMDATVASRSRSMEPFVTTTEVAKFLGLCRRTVAKMAREGRIPAHPVSGTARRTWRFKLSELDEWMQGRINSVRRPPLSERTVRREKEAH